MFSISPVSVLARQLRAVVKEIETRIARQSNRNAEIGALSDYCDRVRGKLANATFERKRLVLEALSTKFETNSSQWTAWFCLDDKEENANELNMSGHSKWHSIKLK
jgi:hypothetical protein